MHNKQAALVEIRRNKCDWDRSKCNPTERHSCVTELHMKTRYEGTEQLFIN